MTSSIESTKKTVKPSKSEQTRQDLSSVFGNVDGYLVFPVAIYGKKRKKDSLEFETTEKLKSVLVTTSTVLGDRANDCLYGFSVSLKWGKETLDGLSLTLGYDGKIDTKVNDGLLTDQNYSVNCFGENVTNCVSIAFASLAKLATYNDPCIDIFLDLIKLIKGLNKVTLDEKTKFPTVSRLELDAIDTLSIIAKHGILAPKDSILYMFATEATKLLPTTVETEAKKA